MKIAMKKDRAVELQTLVAGDTFRLIGQHQVYIVADSMNVRHRRVNTTRLMDGQGEAFAYEAQVHEVHGAFVEGYTGEGE